MTTTADLDCRQHAADPVARRLDHVLTLMHTQRGDPAAEVERLLADVPSCMPAHCLRAALVVRADDAGAVPALAASVAAIEQAGEHADARAHRHAAAARAWLAGDARLALVRYGAIVRDDPRDLAALLVANALDFRLGERRMLRDRPARVLRDWNAAMPGYASVLALHAFGLEENGSRRHAERVARQALALDPDHVGAIHALAHVMEMQGRAHEGIAFLAATEPAWRGGNALAVHLAWHRALFHLEQDDVAGALAVYDRRIACAGPCGIAALVDASALLWRLEVLDVDVGSRWRALADRWESQPLPSRRPFHAVHAMMAFAAARRAAGAASVLAAVDGDHAAGMLPEERLARPLCDAFLAFVRRDFARCVDRLARVRRVAHRCGGSLAQCDLIHLTFTEAALRARKAVLARELVAERTTRKPRSPLNRLLLMRARSTFAAAA